MTKLSNDYSKIDNGATIILNSNLQVIAINDKGYCVSVKSMHPAWNGRVFFIERAEIKSIERAND
jgi:hypothetical protein